MGGGHLLLISEVFKWPWNIFGAAQKQFPTWRLLARIKCHWYQEVSVSAELMVYSPPPQALPLEEAGIQQLKYLQAMQRHVAAAVLGKAM